MPTEQRGRLEGAGIEQRCQDYLIVGNQAFFSDCFEESHAHYEKALSVAEAWFQEVSPDRIETLDNATALFVVAGMNLSDNWLKRNRLDHAVTIMSRMIEALQRKLQYVASSPESGICLTRHMAEAAALLSQYLKRQKETDAPAQNLLEAAHQSAKQFLNDL